MILLVSASAPLVMPPVPSLKCGTYLSVNVPVPLKVLAVCLGTFRNTWLPLAPAASLIHLSEPFGLGQPNGRAPH